MARQPRYQGVGVRPRGIRDIDYAGFREQAQLGQTISSEFDRMGEFVFERGKEKAEQEGLKAVTEQGALPILEKIDQAGGPTTIAEKSAYNAANRIAVTEIQNEAELEITRIMEQAEVNVTPFTQVKKQLNSVADGFSASLSSIDPVAAGQLRSNLQTTVEKSSITYSSWYTKKQASLAADRRTTTGKNDAALIIKNIPAIFGADPDTGNLDAEIDLKAQDYVQNQGWSQENADSWAETTKEAARGQFVSFKIQNSDDVQLKEFIDNVITGKTSITGVYSKDLKYATNAQTVLNSRIGAKKTEAKSIKQDIAEQIFITTNNGNPPSEDWMNAMSTRISSNGEYSIENKQQFLNLRVLKENLNSWSKMSATELEELKLQIKEVGLPGYVGSGEGPVDTPFEVETLNLVSKLRDAAFKLEANNQKVMQEELIKRDTARKKGMGKLVEVINYEANKAQALFSEKYSEVEKQFEIIRKLSDANEPVRPEEFAKFIELYKELDLVPGLVAKPADVNAEAMEDLTRSYEILAFAKGVIDDLADMSQAEIQETVTQINQDIEQKRNLGGYEQLSAATVKKLVSPYIEARKAAVQNDLIFYAQKNGVELQDGSTLEFNPIEFVFKEGETTEDVINRLEQAFQDRKEFSKKAFAKYSLPGQPAKFFTKQEVAQLGALLDGSAQQIGVQSAAVPMQISILTSMFEAVGSTTARQMMAEIFPGQKVYGIAGALLLDNSTIPNAEILLNGKYKIDVEKSPLPGFSDTNTEPVFFTVRQAFNDTLSGNMAEGLRTSAKYIYSQLITADDIKGGEFVFNEDKYIQAVQMSLGASYNGNQLISGGIQEFRERETFLPPGVTPEAFEGMLQQINDDNIYDLLEPNFDQMDLERFDSETIDQIRGLESVPDNTVMGVAGQLRTQKTSVMFDLQLMGGNPQDGYLYALVYPNTNEKLGIPGDEDDNPIIINSNKLKEIMASAN